MSGSSAPIVVLGPTATGKSELAILLARSLGGRVISADSIQVYRGLDVGSCKPPVEIRLEIPHDLIDVADPQEPFSAGRFARMASGAIAACRREGRVPIVAGGTGLYLKALLEGIAPMPPRDELTRARLYSKARESSPHLLHAELEMVDPETARRVGRNDLQRVVRALEVAEMTGVPLSRHIARQGFEPEAMETLKIGLTMDREGLYARIDQRVESIFEAGFVEEVRRLLDGGVPASANALKGLGYREVAAHLRGEADWEQTVALVKRNTRRYARRQIIWFRRESNVHWFDAGTVPLSAIAKQVVELYVGGKG